MRNVVFLVIIILVIAAALFFFMKKYRHKPEQKPEVKQETGPAGYFPITFGSYWKYESNKEKIYMYLISKNELSGDKIFFSLDIRNNYKKLENYGYNPISSLELFKKGDTVYLQAIKNYLAKNADTVFDPPVEFIKMPLSRGQKWGEKGKMEFEVFKEKIKVLGKETDVYRVDSKFPMQGTDKMGVNSIWLADGIGIVKFKTPYIQTKDYETLELTEYKIMPQDNK